MFGYSLASCVTSSVKMKPDADDDVHVLRRRGGREAGLAVGSFARLDQPDARAQLLARRERRRGRRRR